VIKETLNQYEIQVSPSHGSIYLLKQPSIQQRIFQILRNGILTNVVHKNFSRFFLILQTTKTIPRHLKLEVKENLQSHLQIYQSADSQCGSRVEPAKRAIMIEMHHH